MKYWIIVLFTILFVSNSLAQDRGIGVRFGAPMGITYKKYLKHRAVEFGVGTVVEGWYNNYYRNNFQREKKFGNDTYLSHTVSGIAVVQGRYLMRYDIPIEGMIGDLEWYWGIGALLKFGKVEYRFRDNVGVVQREVVSDFDFGPEGIIGMEYTFDEVPITIFGEFSLLLEVADQPGVFRGFSGVGARYNF